MLSTARMYLGATLTAQGKSEQASDVYEKLILEDPAFEPDPLGFPAEIVNAFIDTRARLQERLKTAAEVSAKLEAERRSREEFERRAREAWLEKVKAQAMTERVTVESSRLVAFVPFGAGQLPEPPAGPGLRVPRHPVRAPRGLGHHRAHVRLRARSRERRGPRLRRRRPRGGVPGPRSAAPVLQHRGFHDAFVLVAAAGIVQANAAYVPAWNETKKRDLPVLPSAAEARSSFVPVLSALGRSDGSEAPAGLFVGAAGTFF